MKYQHRQDRNAPDKIQHLDMLVGIFCYHCITGGSARHSGRTHGGRINSRALLSKMEIGQRRNPASDAVMYAASSPPTMARKPTFAISLRLSGASEPMPPT